MFDGDDEDDQEGGAPGASQNDGGDSDDPQDGGTSSDSLDGGLPGGIDPDVPHEPRVSGDPNPDDPPSGNDADGSAAVARNATDTNTVAPQTDGPIISPPVRILFQYDGNWAYKNLRPPSQQNGCYSPLETNHSEGDPNSWKDNGCYPVSFTMVMRWWCEDYPVTQGNITLPAAYSKPLDPLKMCQIFSNTPYFHCGGGGLAARCTTSLPSNKQPANGSPGPTTGATPTCNTPFTKSPPAGDGTQPCAGGCGTDISKLDASACQRAGHNTFSVGEIAPYARQLSYGGNNMTYERWKCTGETGDAKTAKLKAWLLCGPVMACMTKPGHWVVVTGYRDKTIHLCDPGLVINSKKYFQSGVPGDGDANGSGYVLVSEDWLAFVMALDLITFHPIVDANQNAAWNQ